ncbi:MAG TPA: cbb3-type cytochrome c oxidase subunit I [Trebonia sp.]
MAIETQPESAQAPGGGDPGAAPKQRAWWLRPNIFTAIVGAAIGYALGHWLGNFMTPSFVATGGGAADSNDEAIVLGYAFLILGWLAGLGVFNDLVRQMLGKPLNGNGSGSGSEDHASGSEDHASGSVAKYFRFTLDHKVVGLQYLVGMLVYFFTGGLLAIGIRTELLSPSYHVLSPTMYLQVVGEHGTMMMMTSVIVGPFGNYLVPLMIGSKRVAFPRIEALSFWLTPCAYLILLSSFLDGGFPTGWTGYAPLSVQAGEGMDGYAVAFGLMGISVILAGFNIIVTVICYRAPGMRWSRLPMFVWTMLTTAFLFVLTTELISIPTGFIYLVAMGTFWKAKLRLTVPMLFAIAFFFNFLFGGISGVFLSDVPADTTAHGSFFVMAHFHYTIMGGLIFAFFGGVYYWLPKVMGVALNERIGKIHFWTMFLAFNSTFMPLFAAGLLGQPRRVFEYAANLQTLNDWVSISAFCLGGSLCVFVFNFVMSTVAWRDKAPRNPWQARGLEWQVPSPPPPDNFEHVPVVLAGPYEYGDPDALPVADLHPPAGVIGGTLAPPVVSTGAGTGTGE